jgi:hypothetical protein
MLVLDTGIGLLCGNPRVEREGDKTTNSVLLVLDTSIGLPRG